MSGDPFDMDDDPERTVIQPRRAGSPSPADEDKTVLDEIQKRFEVKIEELPTTIDSASYSK